MRYVLAALGTAAFVILAVPAVYASPVDAAAQSLKAAGTAAGRDGSTVGRVGMDGVTTGDGGEVRRRGHQPGAGGANTAGKDT